MNHVLLYELLTTPEEIKPQIRQRSKKFIEKTVSASKPELVKQKVEIEEKDGWKVLRVNKKSTRMYQDKPLSTQLEDELWCILARMGFDEMSKGQNFIIDVGKKVNPRQIDVFAKDRESALCVECTSCEKPKKKSMVKLIEKIESFKSKIALSINKHYGKDPKLKIRWVIATKNVEWGEADLKKAEAAKIYVLRDYEIDYYNKLTKHLKTAAKYQLLAHLFSNEKISGLNISVPATRGSMGGKYFYNFLIKPSELMKIVYVSHKASRDVEALETYQRMLQPTRLKKIAAYIDDGGQFPTNIVINIKNRRKLRFDIIKKIGDSSFGTLFLPNTYASAWVIDGQHRIYGYAHSGRFTNSKTDTATLPVLTYENLPSSEEAQLFVDINCEQIRVSKNLLNEIYATLKWDSESFEERNYALRSRVVMALDSKKTSPFYGRIITTGRDKNHFRCLTLTSFNDGLKENTFFGNSKGGISKPGPLSYKNVDDLEKTMKKAIEVLSEYFLLFTKEMPTHWGIGDGPTGFLCTNNGIRALLRVLKEILLYISKKNNIDLDAKAASELLPDIKNLIEPVIDYFKTASAESIAIFRSRTAKKGVRQNALNMMQFIDKEIPDFKVYSSNELGEYLDTIDEEGTKIARDQISEIQRTLFKTTLSSLKLKYTGDGEDWWYDGISSTIRKDCMEKRENDKGAKKKEQYLNLIHYYDIAYKNWDIFEKYFSFLDIASLLKAFYRVLRSVSGICIYISATVCIIQKFFKNITVMYRGICDGIAANELIFHINADMIFIAIVPFAALYGPPGIGILLALFSTFPILGSLALFDLFIFITAVSLFGSRNNTGIYNLPSFSGIAVVLEEFVKFCKQLFDQIRLGQLIPEKPNGLGVRDSVPQVQIKEAHKRQTIKNLKFYGIIRKIIKGLDDKNFKHQNNIIVFRARVASCFLLPDLFKGRPKLFPIDKPIKLKKRIFVFIEFAKTIMNVKEPCLQNFAPFFGVNCSNQCLATG